VENIFQRSFTLLKILGLDINSLHPKHIDKLSFSLVSKIYKHSLPLGGFGISRYELDNYLYNEAKILVVQLFKTLFRMLNFRW
jgi:hypothetical protein